MGALVGLVVLVTVGTVALGLYFLPTIVAAAGQKRKAGAIFVLNLFLGWTFLGWVLALVWAIADERSRPREMGDPPPFRSMPATQPASLGPATSEPTWKPMPAA